MYMFSRTAKAARFSIKGPTKKKPQSWILRMAGRYRSMFRQEWPLRNRSPLRLTLDSDASLRNTEIKIGRRSYSLYDSLPAEWYVCSRAAL